MLKTNRLVSLILAVVLVVSMFTVAISSTSALSEGETWVVAGSGGLCGSEWQMPPSDSNYMTFNSETGNYEITYYGIAAGTYEFKVVNGTNWGAPDYNLDGSGNGGANATVTVTNDGDNVKISTDGTKAYVEVLAGSGEVTPTADPMAGLSGETTTVYVGVIDYVTDPVLHCWNLDGLALDVALVATGDTISQSFGQLWEGAAQNFAVYTAAIPVEATSFKVHQGDLWPADEQTQTIADLAGKAVLVFEYDNVMHNIAVDYAGSEVLPTTPITGDKAIITVDGTPIEAAVGQKFTYTYKLNVSDITTENSKPGRICGVEGSVYFDGTMVEVLNYNEDEPIDMFPVIYNGGVTSQLFDNELLFNASKESGMLFDTDDKVLVKVDFIVKAAGESDIKTNIKNLSDSDNGRIIYEGELTEGRQWAYTEAVELEELPTQPTEPVTQPTEPVTEPTEPVTEPTEPVTEPTEPVTEPVEGNFIMVDGDKYEVTVGDELTYYAKLNVANCTDNGKIASIDCKVTYPENVVAFVETVDEFGDADKLAMFPILGKSTITNFAPENEAGTLYFNYSSTDGERFNTDESVLVKLTFKVVAEGNGTIDTEIRTMAKTDEAVTKIVYNSERLEDFTYIQTLEGNTVPSTLPSETIPSVTEPEGLFVKADGVLYEAEQGQTFNYIAYLTVPGVKISSIDATTFYNTDGLDIQVPTDEYGDVNKAEMFPIMLSPIFNTDIDGQILFNYSNADGVRFNDATSVLITVPFTVTAESGVYEINTVLKDLADADMNYYIKDNAVINGDFTLVNVTDLKKYEPTTPSETEPSETEPSETEPSETEPSETVPGTEPPATDDDPTVAPPATDDEPVNGVFIKVDGELYETQKGDVFTYVYYLSSDRKISSLDATTFYDATGLKYLPAVDEYGDAVLPEMFPVLQSVIYNGGIEGQVLYNYSNVNGVRLPIDASGEMTDANRVFVAQFEVTADNGIYEINTFLKVLGDADNNKIIFDGDKIDDSAVVNELEALLDVDAPEEPTQPSTEPGTQPGTEPGTQPGTEPGTQPGTEPGDEEPGNDEPSEEEPGEEEPGEDIPGAATSGQSSTTDQSNATSGVLPKTGSTEASIAFITILVMAAGVVLYARKRKFD